MPRCLSHRQSSPHPSTQVASPRFLSQVLFVNLLLNLPPNLHTQVASPGTSSRYSFSTRTTVLDGWWQCFLKLLLLFCLRSFLSPPPHLCRVKNMKNVKTGGISTSSPHRRCLHHWYPETGDFLFNAQENFQKTDWIFEDIFQETNVTLSMLSTNPLFHTSFFRDVLAHCRYSPMFPYSQVIIRHVPDILFFLSA